MPLFTICGKMKLSRAKIKTDITKLLIPYRSQKAQAKKLAP
jgi:hypothetical protein